MEKRGERLQTSWEREQSARAPKVSSGRKGISLLGRLLRGAMAVLLMAGLLPLVPGSPAVEEAEADLVQCTDMNKLFYMKNNYGRPGAISGNRLTVANTRSYAPLGYDNGWSSSADMNPYKPVSLLQSWDISATVFMDQVNSLAGLRCGQYGEVGFRLGAAQEANGYDEYLSVFEQSMGLSGSVEGAHPYRSLMLLKLWGADGKGQWEITRTYGSKSVTAGQEHEIWLGYDPTSNGGTLTFTHEEQSFTATGIRNRFGDSAYLSLVGNLDWQSLTSSVNAPSCMGYVEFQKFGLPRFDPVISDIRAYRADGTLIDPEKDLVEKGDRVRVVCTVKNQFSDPRNEEYGVHLKLANTAAYPTKGATIASNEPVTAGSDAYTFSGDGVPITLKGSTPVEVSYWCTISANKGDEVSISHELVEDSFLSSYFKTLDIVEEQPLVSGGAGEGADPDDPSTWGDAGKDYHYTRLPAANVNGWNNSPVTVTFYPGDYDVMDLTPSQGSAKSLTVDDPAWTQSADTAGIDLSAQAKNTNTGAVSVTRAGKVKIDSDAPRLTVTGRALGSYTADDTPTDASKVSSGLWRLHRTGASGVASDATVYREFATIGTDGDRAGANQTESLANLPNGYYVAEDAAGNRSTPLKVGDTEPPTVERPDLDGPDAPDPAGPPYDPTKDPVPSPTETEGEDGLRHAVIDETVTEIIDPASPPFEGSLDETDAKAMMDYRYAASSAATIASTTDELLDASGNPISSLDTKAPGECLVRRVITDDQGNTTTINLHYRCVRDSCPPVSPLEPVDPDDPTGPKQPGDPLQPDGPVTTDPDGSQHVEVSADVTEAVTRGVMDALGAEDLLRRHFALADADGGTGVTLTMQSMENASGNRISSIDLSRVANYKITYLVRDATGNTTTVRLGYHLVSSRVPGVVVTPDPGADPNPQPGNDPLNPKPRPIDPPYPPEVAPDGTQHATIEDEMRVKVQESASLDLADVRSLVERRYDFTPEGGGSVTELSLSIADVKGAPATAIDLSRPSSWLITYKIADANGNTVTIHLRYLVVSGAPEVTPTPGGDGAGGDTGGGSGDDGTGDSSGGGTDPLPPISSVVDPETGLTHSIVEDTVVVGTSDEAATPETMAQFLVEHYAIASALSDGTLNRGPVQLFDASGNPVTQIDRTKPGDWLAVQVVTDSAGNTTTIRVKYLVREGDVSGGISGNGQGNGNGSGAGSGSAQNGGAGSSTDSGEGHGSKLATRIHQLPQTGGIFGPCPLHIMFVLIMVLASAYTMMRLRQESSRREDRRHNAEWEEASHEFA